MESTAAEAIELALGCDEIYWSTIPFGRQLPEIPYLACARHRRPNPSIDKRKVTALETFRHAGRRASGRARCRMGAWSTGLSALSFAASIDERVARLSCRKKTIATNAAG